MWTSSAVAAVVVGAISALAFDLFEMRRAALLSAVSGLSAGAAFFALSAPAPNGRLWDVLNSGGRYGSVGLVICGLAAVSLLGGWDQLAAERSGGSLAGLVALGGVSAAVVALSANLTMLLVGVESLAACSYALVATGGRGGSREAAIKYFVQGAVATTLLLFSIAVFVGLLAPSGDLGQLSLALRGPMSFTVLALGAVMGVAALAFKSGSAPFHMWVPDAYEMAAWHSAGFLASSAKVAGIAALVVFAGSVSVGRLSIPLIAVIAILAVSSVLLGSVGALNQSSYSRMLAYGGVAQVGYALIAIATGDSAAALLFVATYGVASAGAFVAGAAFLAVRPDWDGSIDALSGMGHEAPQLGLATGALMVSLIGIPPLLGFWGKLAVFASALSGGVAALSGGSAVLGAAGLIAGAAGVVGSAVSVGYYGRVLRVLYESAAPADDAHAESAPSNGIPSEAVEDTPKTSTQGLAAIVTVMLGILTVGIGLMPLLAGEGAALALFR